MTIHLIRHGKTLANEKKLYCGQTDLPLSEQGAAALLALKAQSIYPVDVDLFFTSGLLRTEETLALLYGSVPREALPRLAEFRFGLFEMKSYEELKEQADYRAWISDETGLIACPQGDCRQDFTKRVLSGYAILREKTGTVLAVCHGGVIVCIMDELFPGIRHFYEWQPEPGRGYSITYGAGGAKWRAI